MTACREQRYNGIERRSTCEHAESAAKKAVKEVFAILGVDVDDPRQVKCFQEDLRFGEKLRKLSDKGLGGIVGAIAAIIGASIWYAVTRQH